MTKCDLCILEKKTKWYYEDERVVVCDCLSCKVPMIVLREHTVRVTPETIAYLVKIAQQVFGENIELRTQQRTVLDHLHWHIFTVPA